jgi:hypothetical protein
MKSVATGLFGFHSIHDPAQGGEQRPLQPPEPLTALLSHDGVLRHLWRLDDLDLASAASVYRSLSLRLVDAIIFISSGLGIICPILMPCLTATGVVFLGMGETSVTVTP